MAARGYQCGGGSAGVSVRGWQRGGSSAGIAARGYQCGGQGAVDARGGSSAGVQRRGGSDAVGSLCARGHTHKGLIASRRHHKYSFDGTQ